MAMRVRVQIAHLAGMQISAFDLVLVTPPASEVGLVVFHRAGSPTHRVLQVEVPYDALALAPVLIKRELDPQGSHAVWLGVAAQLPHGLPGN